MDSSSRAGLLSLPTELLLIILSHFDYSSKLALQWTCKSLNSVMKDHRFSRAYTMTDLLEIERWPCFSMGQQGEGTKQPIGGLDYFACHICFKIRSAEYFSNAMMKGHRGKLSPTLSPERAHRFCIPCGVRFYRYHPGVRLQYGGATGGDGVVCYKCHRFKKVVGLVGFKERTCGACLRSQSLSFNGDEEGTPYC
ncbi:hypothetical protein BDV23DRAFT_149343 [Aspergillus alliaceus]|uniref:F-box domain-containing protein n=1 Tax=Petromyces alliaceus TaxID=209559 RepID=A0A5N7CJ90_PETAA|nr:hypothetical protein BDV23DRAFT_149343 [Aspergillus alliaceus]